MLGKPIRYRPFFEYSVMIIFQNVPSLIIPDGLCTKPSRPQPPPPYHNELSFYSYADIYSCTVFHSSSSVVTQTKWSAWRLPIGAAFNTGELPTRLKSGRLFSTCYFFVSDKPNRLAYKHKKILKKKTMYT